MLTLTWHNLSFGFDNQRDLVSVCSQICPQVDLVYPVFDMYEHNTHTHTHPFNGPSSGATWVSRYQKGRTIWILRKQETVSGSGVSWAICKSAPRSRQITMPAPHHSVFLQVGCPSCRQTNSVKAVKARLICMKLDIFV